MTDQTAEAVKRLGALRTRIEEKIGPGVESTLFRLSLEDAAAISTLLADRERLRLALVAFYADMQPTADKAALGRLLQGFGMGNAPESRQPTVNVADFVAALNTQGEG